MSGDDEAPGTPLRPACPPHPATHPAASIWSAAPFIAAYWTAAIGVVLMNADILRKMRCPAMLTAWHQFCCTVLVFGLRTLLPGLVGTAPPRLPAAVVLKRVAPIAALFALTLGVGNRAYMYLSVAFIQMVKASHPVTTYVLSCLLGVEAFRQNKLQATFLVTLGVMLSVTGEMHFSLRGFGFQMFGSLAECLRVVLIGVLLSKQGLKLDPLTTVSYIAPIAFLVLVPMALLTEWPADFTTWRAEVEAKVGYLTLLFNGLLAFALNLAVVSLIARTDPVVYVVVGVLKDILTVVISSFIFTSPVTHLQVVGYLTALAGVQVYNLVQKNPEDFEVSLHSGLLALARKSWSPSLHNTADSAANLPTYGAFDLKAPDVSKAPSELLPEVTPASKAVASGQRSGSGACVQD